MQQEFEKFNPLPYSMYFDDDLGQYVSDSRYDECDLVEEEYNARWKAHLAWEKRKNDPEFISVMKRMADK